MKYRNKKRFSKLVWGLLLLLAATFIIANQVGGFAEIGFWSILVGALALAFSLASLIELKFASLPIPLAILYLVIQNPLNLPHINPWLLILAALLASIGINVMLPKKWRTVSSTKTSIGSSGRTRYKDSDLEDAIEDFVEGVVEDVEDVIEDIVEDVEDWDEDYEYEKRHVVRDDYDNKPTVSVSFGSESRYLHSDSLETAHLDCKFGSLEVYFDQATLSPNGANVYCDCKFGSIELFVPKEWRVKDIFSVTIGNAELGRQRVVPAADTPLLTIRGSVTFGSIEVRFV